MERSGGRTCGRVVKCLGREGMEYRMEGRLAVTADCVTKRQAVDAWFQLLIKVDIILRKLLFPAVVCQCDQGRRPKFGSCVYLLTLVYTQRRGQIESNGHVTVEAGWCQLGCTVFVWSLCCLLSLLCDQVTVNVIMNEIMQCICIEGVWACHNLPVPAVYCCTL